VWEAWLRGTAHLRRQLRDERALHLVLRGALEEALLRLREHERAPRLQRVGGDVGGWGAPIGRRRDRRR